MALHERGSYRGVYSVLFDDLDFQRLPALARWVFCVLRQQAGVGPAAIYLLSLDLLDRRTGLKRGEVVKALGVLEVEGWIAYQEPIVWVVNGLRHDPGVRLSNRKHQTAVLGAVALLPRLPIVAKFLDYYGLKPTWRDSLPHSLSDSLSTGYANQGVVSSEVVSSEEGRVKSEVKHTSARARRAPARVTPEGFEEFWQAYPLKEARGAAEQVWTKLAPDAALRLAMLDGLRRWLGSKRWAEGFVTHAATWLNQRRWQDEPRPATGLSNVTEQNIAAARDFAERRKKGLDP